MPELSVIIPTCERAHVLRDALESVVTQTFDPESFDVVIVDNGAESGTCEIVAALRNESRSVRYVHEEQAGLHNARHRGAREANSDVLVYVDDDIRAEQGWLHGIRERFSDEETGIVVGRTLPRWEAPVPEWMEGFRNEVMGGWHIGFLSLLDFGEASKEIPPRYVYGCNFAIRKELVHQFGGFHPDAMPQELIRFRGDGESGLARAVAAGGWKIVYEPKALVYHRIPKDRLTVEYFCQRAFNQGVSDSYAEIRSQGGLREKARQPKPKQGVLRRARRWWWKMHTPRSLGTTREEDETSRVKKKVMKALEEGRAYHRAEVKKDPELLKYVLQETYY